MWIQSGASEFRFRVCLSQEPGSPGCVGKSIEERSCRTRRFGYCQTALGKTVSKQEHKCDGTDVIDYTKLGSAYASTQKFKCESILPFKHYIFLRYV